MAEMLQGDSQLNCCILVMLLGSMVANLYVHFKIQGLLSLGASETHEPYGCGLLLWRSGYSWLYTASRKRLV